MSGAAPFATSGFTLLSLMLAGISGVAMAVALTALRSEQRQRREADAARHRAALAESALADIRARRSLAVSKGNRTRGAVQAEKRAERLAAMREQIAVRDAPQTEFPFSNSQSGGNHD
jgi:type II secretory pathway pseudopilin PulG